MNRSGIHKNNILVTAAIAKLLALFLVFLVKKIISHFDADGQSHCSKHVKIWILLHILLKFTHTKETKSRVKHFHDPLKGSCQYSIDWFGQLQLLLSLVKHAQNGHFLLIFRLVWSI